MQALFAGLDVSTQSCKLVVIDPDAGAVVHVDRVAYDNDLPGYGTEDGAVAGLGEGVSESDPRMWIEAVEILLGRLSDAGVPTGHIRCISVSGQQHGLVALTADGDLARPRAKLWNDFSTAEECRILTAAVGGPESMIEEVGNSQRTGYTAPKILHMRRHEPEAYARASTLFVVHNYINAWRSGIRAPVAGQGRSSTRSIRGCPRSCRRWSRRIGPSGTSMRISPPASVCPPIAESMREPATTCTALSAPGTSSRGSSR
jgi:xylulokinase